MRSEFTASPLLEERRKKYKIPEFPYALAYDRVAIYQLDTQDGGGETFKNSVIVKADTTKKRERLQSPRGVLVGAGLTAFDNLYGFGIELGQIVWFMRLSVWQHEFDQGNGRHTGFAILTAGEITGSEDVWAALKKGHLKIQRGEDGRHVIDDRRRVDRPATFDM